MNKGELLLASALLLSAGVLAACSGGKSSLGSSGSQTLLMSYAGSGYLRLLISKILPEFTGNAVDGHWK